VARRGVNVGVPGERQQVRPHHPQALLRHKSDGGGQAPARVGELLGRGIRVLRHRACKPRKGQTVGIPQAHRRKAQGSLF